jgi:hypothetical protein
MNNREPLEIYGTQTQGEDEQSKEKKPNKLHQVRSISKYLRKPNNLKVFGNNKPKSSEEIG